MLSRKDVRPRQIKFLLDNGLLPVSIDYRLCPELNLLQGPMTDVCDGLRWARDELPNLRLKCLGIQVDGNQVVVVGWSSGGHLATTLAWTARLRNVRPPEAILAFYCPLDYEDECESLESPELSVLLLISSQSGGSRTSLGTLRLTHLRTTTSSKLFKTSRLVLYDFVVC